MTRKATLRTNPEPLHALLHTLTLTFTHDFSSLPDPLLHFFLVLQLRELARNHAQNDILVLWQIGERLEPTRTWGIVLEVVRVHVKRGEELRSDAIVATLREMPRVDKVATAQVYAYVHVRGNLAYAVVVQANVEIEEFVGSDGVARVFLPALEHLF
jgi:hypothetical protein